MNKLMQLIKAEETRQKETLMMIPSENYASKKVRAMLGSVLTNKYSEGYAKKRYYQGNKFIDEIELFAIEKAKELFEVEHVNVQPYSGSPANSEILFALLSPGDTIMGLKLSAGGHLTHGQPDITFSGKYFRSVQFDLDDAGRLNYAQIQKLAKKEKPKLMIVGTTAYPLAFDWKKFAQIAESVNSWLVADISHVAGLVLADTYPSPIPHAHVIITTTHKTLRGPRGAIIMVTKKGLKKDPELASKIDRAVFPGMQGGPHNNTTAAILQALNEADSASFRKYGKQVVLNAKKLADTLVAGGIDLVCGTTECHLMVIDLRTKELSGNVVAEALEIAGIVVNRNSVPKDNMPPFYPSGIRLGTPGVTSRGLGETQMIQIGKWIIKVIDHVSDVKLPQDQAQRSPFMKEFKQKIAQDKYLLDIALQVKKMLLKYPLNF